MMTHAQRHRWFDKWLSASSPDTRRLTDDAITLVAQFEQHTNSRRRKRRPEDDRKHRIMVEVVTMNLVLAILTPPPSGFLAVLTGHMKRPRTRYDHPDFGEPFASLLTTFASIGWLTFRPSPGMDEASAIAPTELFRAKVRATAIDLAAFNRDAGEPIILSRKKPSQVADDPKRELIDYAETETTTGLRDQMVNLNRFLAKADITFLDDGLGLVDIHQRQQRRYFSTRSATHEATFDGGGRMFGGCWSNLPRGRRGSIRIEGETLGLLDFSSMFVRLAYARIGKPPPPSDLYAIPGLIGQRRATKLIVNCLMFDEHDRRRWPVVTASDQMMPKGLTMPRVKALIALHHPDLVPLFGTGIGHTLMLTESTILMEVLLEMKTRGIVGLGLHDGMMVPASRTNEVKTLMMEVSRQITSHTIPVNADPIGSGHRSVQPNPPPYSRGIRMAPACGLTVA